MCVAIEKNELVTFDCLFSAHLPQFVDRISSSCHRCLGCWCMREEIGRCRVINDSGMPQEFASEFSIVFSFLSDSY